MHRAGITYEFLALDDGSTDGTGAVLDGLTAEVAGLKVMHHENRGHGPTILAGYRAASAPWVFQFDSDDEVGPSPFEGLWRMRDDFDVILGRRVGRDLTAARRLLTAASRLTVRGVFGRGLSDPNTPYRLMRQSVLAELVSGLRADTFAPNVIISGLAARRGFCVGEQEVACRPPAAIPPVSWNVARAALRSFAQTVSAARRTGRKHRGGV
jgi:glycosyltransferase involved in cell wall biosynthesis